MSADIYHQMDPISSKVSACLEHLEALLSAEYLEENKVPAWAWRDELGRLRIWCLETGDRKTNQLSLDYRLRDAAGLSASVIRWLDFMLKQLEKARSNLQRPVGGPYEILSISSEEESSQSESEDKFKLPEWLVQKNRALRPPWHPSLTQLQICHRYIISCISNLNGLISELLDPASLDYFVCFSDRNKYVFRFKNIDTQHVVSKLPSALGFSTRLGLNISRCRVTLKYRERCYRDPRDPDQIKFGRFQDVYPDDEPATTKADDSPPGDTLP